MHQKILISLAQYNFLLEVQAQANYEKNRRKLFGFYWLKLENVASCSPSALSLTNWVTTVSTRAVHDLWREWKILTFVFCQSDGGQKGNLTEDKKDKKLDSPCWTKVKKYIKARTNLPILGRSDLHR
jgi:hypothetical protein